MSLLWMEGFDTYGTGTGTAEGGAFYNMRQGLWAETGDGSTRGIYATISRTGGRSLALYMNGTFSVFRRILGASYTTIGIGAAFFLESLPTLDNRWVIFGWNDSANARQCTVSITTTGAIRVYRGSANSGTILGTSADGVVVAGSWQHIEAKAVIHDTTGAIEVRINGVAVISVSGVDTKNTTVAGAAQMVMGRDAAGADAAFVMVDDLFVWNDQGSRNNDFIGDSKVYPIYPTANDATMEWSANGAANQWDCVDGTSPNGDTDYISAAPSVSSPPYVTSEFTLGDLPSGVGAINAIQVTPMSKKTDAGTANLQSSILSSSAVAAGTDRPLTTQYTYYADVFEVDPNTGTAWTKSGFDAAHLRIRRTL